MDLIWTLSAKAAPPKDQPLWFYSVSYSAGAIPGYWNKDRGWWSRVGGGGSCLATAENPPTYWMLRTEPPAPPDFAERGG